MVFKKIIYLSFLLLVVSCSSQKSEHAAKPRPNILYIMGDDHTSQAISAYGSILDSLAVTPHIDRLAEQGARLTNVFCTNSICTPSRATILTGQYSHKNQVYTLRDSLDPGHEQVAKLLHRHGYQTAIVGKWHLKTQPQGFDYFNILPGQGRYHDPVLRTAANWDTGGREYQGFSTDVITDQALQWLDRRDPEKPFLLMTHFKASHEPFNYAQRFDTLYQNTKMPEPKSLFNFYPDRAERTFQGQVLEILGRRFVANHGHRYPGPPFSLEGLTDRQRREKIYQRFIKDFLRSGATIDDNVGRILRYLKEHKLSDNTIVIYTADQGYFLGEHGLFDKRMMYEQALRMPFIIRYPGHIPAGSTVDDMILNTDFAPLMLDYAGVPRPAAMQGRSFRPNLSGHTPSDWRTALYYRYWMHQQHRPAHFGIRTSRYMLMFLYGQPLMDVYGEPPTEPTWEFYDLQKDPREVHNAYGDPGYQPVIKRLKTRLLRLKRQAGDTEVDKQHPVMQQIINHNF